MGNVLRSGIDTVNVISPYPAAGKGTVIKPLKQDIAARGKVGHMEVGQIVRTHKEEGTLIGQAAKDYENRGLMVPDEVIVPEIRRNIKLLDPTATWLFDGFPRVGSQIQQYEELMTRLERSDHFVYLNVPREIAEQRMVLRGKKAIEAGQKPRSDDVDAEARKNRLDGAEADMKQVIEYFGAKGLITEIDGSMTPDEVFVAVQTAIYQHVPMLEKASA